MKFFRSPVFIVLLVISGLFVAGYLLRKKLLLAMLPQVERVVVDKISVVDDSAYVSMSIIVKNTSWSDYELYHSDISVTSDTVTLVHYVNDSTLTLDQNQVKVFPVKFTVPVRSTIRRIKDLQDNDSTQILVTGNIDFNTVLGRSNRTFRKNVSVPVPVPPKMRIAEIVYLGQIKKGKMYDFRMKLSVVNENKKEFWFKNVTYKMNAGKLIESFGKMPDVRIPPLDSVTMNVPFHLKIENEVGLFFKVLFNNDVVTYRININGTIVSLAGVEQDIPASYTSTGQVELYDPQRKKVKFIIAKNKN
jgi:hypothetical protein